MSNTNFQSNGTDFLEMYDITTDFVDSTQATAITGYKVGNDGVDLANMFSLKSKVYSNGNYRITDASNCSFTYGVSNANISSLFVQKGLVPKQYYVRDIVSATEDFTFQFRWYTTHISFAIFGAGGGGGTGGWGASQGNGKGGGGGGAGAVLVVNKLPVLISDRAIIKIGKKGNGGTHAINNVPATYAGVNGNAPLGNGTNGGTSTLTVFAHGNYVGQRITRTGTDGWIQYNFEAGGGYGGTAGVSSDQSNYSDSGKGGKSGNVFIYKFDNPDPNGTPVHTNIDSNDQVQKFVVNTYGGTAGVDSGSNSAEGVSNNGNPNEPTEGGNGGVRQSFSEVFSTFYSDYRANFPNSEIDRLGKYGSATNTDFYILNQDDNRIVNPGTFNPQSGHGFGIGGGGGGGRSNVPDRGDWGANGKDGGIFMIGYQYM